MKKNCPACGYQLNVDEEEHCSDLCKDGLPHRWFTNNGRMSVCLKCFVGRRFTTITALPETTQVKGFLK